jgi:probable rRNA maturation factor
MSGYEIEVIDEAEAGGQVADLLRLAARAALLHEGVGVPAGLSILLTDDAALQDLNQQFLGIAAPTDVLSFPAGEPGPGDQGNYLGDIAISVPRATAQATAAGHSRDAELQLLTVHGVLHLLGHDHAAAAEKGTMWQAQAGILKALGAPISGPALDA